ncbi:MAG TPA: hypothetical protein VGE28_03955 [Pseudomonas sp.]
MKGSSHCDKSRPAMPEFYMPAMWPVGLHDAIADWVGAWFWRRRMRRLLAQDALGEIRLGGARAVVEQGAGEPLRLIAQRRACWLRGEC